MSLEESKLSVLFNNSCSGTIKFNEMTDFLLFESLHEQFKPKHNPFEALGHNFIARKSTIKPKGRKSGTEMLKEVKYVDFRVFV